MKKEITVEQSHTALKLCKKVGLAVNPTFVFGMPGENDESVNDTINFFKEHDMHTGIFYIATPFPGTELWNIAKEKGYITPENEEEFVLSLVDTRALTINFTDWTDKELLEKKCKLEHDIQRAYYKRHPKQYLIDTWQSICNTQKFIRLYGFMGVVSLGVKKIKRDFGLLNMKEFIKKYQNVITIILFVIITSGLEVDYKYVILGFLAIGFYANRRWLKQYYKDWKEQYNTLRGIR